MITTVNPEEVNWVFNYAGVDEDVFEENKALALLLLNEVVILNEHWWKKDWPQDAQKTFAIAVDCSDIFYYASADAEPMEYEDLQEVYEYWMKDNTWGPAVWCCVNRCEQPLKRVYDKIQALGIWDLDNMELAPQPPWSK